MEIVLSDERQRVGIKACSVDCCKARNVRNHVRELDQESFGCAIRGESACSTVSAR